MKKVNNILGRMEASLNGSLDGLQLDNTADVIEKSLVIEMVNNLKMLVNEAQTEVKNISSNAVLADSKPRHCPKCNSPNVIMFDADNDLCNDCGAYFC